MSVDFVSIFSVPSFLLIALAGIGLRHKSFQVESLHPSEVHTGDYGNIVHCADFTHWHEHTVFNRQATQYLD